jgi:NAD(P)-dependent dehydrogenase (short-subunit alcohol dehydrogenase family)
MLTDVQIRKAKAADKPYKLTDGGGLHVYVTSAGGKLWRLRYEFERKEKLLSIGPYPSVGLAEAREVATNAKRLLREGKDPAVEKRLRRLQIVTDGGTTFEVVAREWHDMNKGHWVEQHAYDVLHSLERDVFPDLGSAPIKNITAANVILVLRKIENRSAAETARRIRQRMSAVFVYAIASGRAENDPAAAVQKAMRPVKKGRQPAITDLEQAREVLRHADATPASPVTKLALRLLALTVLRPGTLITTPWVELDDLDPEIPIWQVPAARMKLRLQYKHDDERDHLVPLPTQAIDVIKALRKTLPRFKAQGSGQFITVCSMTSFLPMPGLGSYSGAKHALRAFHHALAFEERHSPLHFTIVHPGATETPMLEQEKRADDAVITFATKSVPAWPSLSRS